MDGRVGADRDRRRRGHGPGDADRGVRPQRREQRTDVLGASFELLLGRRVRRKESLGEADAPRLRAHRPGDPVAVRHDELGRAAADVDEQRARAQGAVARDAPQHELGLLATVEHPRREPVAPLDLAQERLPVVGIAHGARPDREHALGAELLRLSSVVDEHVPDARHGGGEEDPAPIDRLAHPGDRLATDDLLDEPVLDVGDEQAGRVRAEVDGGDSHALTLLRCRPGSGDSAQTPGRNQSRRRIV